MEPADLKQAILETRELTEQIIRLLVGRDPGVQATVIAELLALMLQGLPKEKREEALQGFMQTVRAYPYRDKPTEH